MNYKITQFGKELDKSKYTFDEGIKTLITKENNLVLDFSGMDGVIFITGYNCTFYANNDCIFKTGKECVIIRRDIYEVIELKENQVIQSNGHGIKGYTIKGFEIIE